MEFFGIGGRCNTSLTLLPFIPFKCYCGIYLCIRHRDSHSCKDRGKEIKVVSTK